MWRFVRSTDELVTEESSTSSTVNAASAQNRFPHSVIHYLKSTEGILRVVVILSRCSFKGQDWPRTLITTIVIPMVA